MKTLCNYKKFTACQFCVAGIDSQEKVTATISGSDCPIWAVSQIDLGGGDGLQVTTATDGPLSRMSSFELTSDSVTVLAPKFESLSGHGLGPQIPLLIIRLYIWALDVGQVVLQRSGADQPSIGFVFGHAESVSDWNWIGTEGLIMDWPTSA